MATTNLLLGLENKISVLRGELSQARKEVKTISDGWNRLPELQSRVNDLAETIAAAERVIRHDYPDWQPTRVKPRKPGKWRGLFKSGDIGRKALTVLRKADEWMRPIEVARAMLAQIGHDPDDRIEREKLSNSIGAYFKSWQGDLVESRGSFAKEWRVIR